MKNNEIKNKVIKECESIITNCDFETGLIKFMNLEKKYPEEVELIASKIDQFIKNNH